MSFRLNGLLAVCLAGAVTGLPVLAQAQGQQPERTRYIVVFKANTSDVRQQAEAMANGAASRPDFVYEHALKGFALTLPTRTAAPFLEAMRRNPLVESIETDATVRRQQTTQPGATWGLDRIDQRALPLDTAYRYVNNGQGVQVHVIDTGVRGTHVELAGRMLPGYTAIADGQGTNDCDGHGTHVAATTAGSVYGVAKGASVVPVRVLDCTGSGTTSGVIAGLDWVAANAVRPAVANMSLGGGASTALDSAVANVVSRGIPVAVAAGNSNTNACNSSPARAPSALTVGATTSTDARASYSNFGSCLDLFAPGSSITSAGIASDTAIATLSGTSMASPHVAGNVALLLQADPTLTPAAVEQQLKSRATTNRVTSAGTGSPNLLLYTGTDVATPVSTVFVGDLVGSRTTARNNWTARATVTVRDAQGALVSGAQVSGRFSASTSTYACTTSTAGTCAVSITLRNTVTSTAYTVSGITGTNMSYDATRNVRSSVTITR